LLTAVRAAGSIAVCLTGALLLLPVGVLLLTGIFLVMLLAFPPLIVYGICKPGYLSLSGRLGASPFLYLFSGGCGVLLLLMGNIFSASSLTSVM
jgi:hypothetical protein